MNDEERLIFNNSNGWKDSVAEGEKERQTKVVLLPNYKDGDIRPHEYSLLVLPFPNQHTKY